MRYSTFASDFSPSYRLVRPFFRCKRPSLLFFICYKDFITQNVQPAEKGDGKNASRPCLRTSAPESAFFNQADYPDAKIEDKRVSTNTPAIRKKKLIFVLSNTRTHEN